MDCVEKTDLKKRALSVWAASPLKEEDEEADVDENYEESSSDEEDTHDSSSSSAKKTSSTSKRFSVFRAKKFVTSRMGDTRVGRAAVMKVLGEDGDVVVQALKSATTKVKDLKSGKEYKKVGIRMCLKAFNLWKHKDLNVEDSKPLQRDSQLLAEMFVRDSVGVANGKRCDVASLVKMAHKLHDGVMDLMKPHIQEKNALKLSEILKFFSSHEFLDPLLNSKQLESERMAIEKATLSVLLPLTPILSGERERTTLMRNRNLLKTLDNPRLDMVIDQPQVAQLFQQYLDLEMGLASKNCLRFYLAVRDFEKTASRPILRIRAPKIYGRYLVKSSDMFVNGVNDDAVAVVKSCLDNDQITMNLFSLVLDNVRSGLEDDFVEQFVTSKDYKGLKNHLMDEMSKLEKRLKDEGSFLGGGALASPSPTIRKGLA